MGLRVILDKIFKNKHTTPEPLGEDDPHGMTMPEISFERLDTQMQMEGIFGEIDVFLKDTKVNVYTLGPETRIGRDPAQADVVVPELIISKLHCTILNRDNAFVIRDDGSTNGVYIKNERVTEQELRDGDVVWLGKKGTVKLIFHQRR